MSTNRRTFGGRICGMVGGMWAITLGLGFTDSATGRVAPTGSMRAITAKLER